MPSGKVHLQLYKKHSVWVVPFVGLSSYILTGDLITPAVTSLGYGLGYYVSPDLDLIGLNSDEGRMMNHYPVVGHLMVAWWFLYAGICQIFGGHRSRFSHGYIIGALFRLIWMFIPLVYIWTKISFLPVIPLETFVFTIFVPLWVGLAAADAVHITADFAS